MSEVPLYIRSDQFGGTRLISAPKLTGLYQTPACQLPNRKRIPQRHS